jgi:GNAT superfamily N-acetyltransferase
MIDVKLVAPAHLDALADLFRACECPCFCRYWHFEGDKNAWLERCAISPAANEAEMRADVVNGEPRAGGLVAFDADERTIVGWMKLAPRATLSKLRNGRVYRALDLGDDAGVLSIGCMLVRPDVRKTGVARALVTAAPRIAKERGAQAIEAYPHAMKDLGPHQVWMGPASLFESLGFKHVTGESPYPVFRLDLRNTTVT